MIFFWKFQLLFSCGEFRNNRPSVFLAMRLMAGEIFTQLFKRKIFLFPVHKSANIMCTKVAYFSREPNSARKFMFLLLFLQVLLSFMQLLREKTVKKLKNFATSIWNSLINLINLAPNFLILCFTRSKNMTDSWQHNISRKSFIDFSKIVFKVKTEVVPENQWK